MVPQKPGTKGNETLRIGLRLTARIRRMRTPTRLNRRRLGGRTVRLGVLLVLSVCGLSCDRTPRVRTLYGDVPIAENLLLVTVDTLRGDSVLTEHSGIRLTPELDRWGQESLTFLSATSASNVTAPGLAGLLTGLAPYRSGVIGNANPLQPQVTTLAELLLENGFETAGIVANPVVRPGYGFEDGFEHYELIPRTGHLRKARAAAVVDRVLEWFETPPSERWFLWVHFMDPHGPYQPPKQTRRLFPVESFPSVPPVPLLEPNDASGRGGIPSYQQLPTGSNDAREYQARYLAEIRYWDSEVGRLLNALELSGQLEGTVVAFSADHGEAMVDDHGYYFSHGNGLTEDQTHVPLMVRAPGLKPGALTHPVSTLDIVPTVLELLGIATVTPIDGESLLQDRDVERVLSQAYRKQSIRVGDWKLTRIENSPPELYHLTTDPLETTNLAEHEPDRVRRLTRQLREFRRLPPVAEPIDRKAVDEEERETLKALGYVQ